MTFLNPVDRVTVTLRRFHGEVGHGGCQSEGWVNGIAACDLMTHFKVDDVAYVGSLMKAAGYCSFSKSSP